MRQKCFVNKLECNNNPCLQIRLTSCPFDFKAPQSRDVRHKAENEEKSQVKQEVFRHHNFEDT